MYELLCIIPAVYTADEMTSVMSKVEELLKKQGAIIKKSENLGNLKFAYTISKNTNGYYLTFVFDCDGQSIKKLNRALQLNKDIIRFIISKKSKHAVSVKPIEFVKVEPDQKTHIKKDFVKKPKNETNKIKVEEIGDKLESILEKDIIK